MREGIETHAQNPIAALTRRNCQRCSDRMTTKSSNNSSVCYQKYNGLALVYIPRDNLLTKPYDNLYATIFIHKKRKIGSFTDLSLSLSKLVIHRS